MDSYRVCSVSVRLPTILHVYATMAGREMQDSTILGIEDRGVEYVMLHNRAVQSCDFDLSTCSMSSM
jgi:hypothetical protein